MIDDILYFYISTYSDNDMKNVLYAVDFSEMKMTPISENLYLQKLIPVVEMNNQIIALQGNALSDGSMNTFLETITKDGDFKQISMDSSKVYSTSAECNIIYIDSDNEYLYVLERAKNNSDTQYFLNKYTKLKTAITDSEILIFPLMMAVLLFCLFSVSCINKQKREYRHMCDSLSKMDFPPRVLDTLFFRKYGNGIEVDTTFPNGEQHLIQLDYANNYYYAIEYPNIPIIDVMSYDGKDGKLIDWHQRFIDWNNISPWVWYDKEGNVCELSATCSEEKDYIYPTYSIHQLIEKLKQENIDLFHNTSIYYGTDYRDADSIPCKKCGWHVMMKDTTVSNDTCNMTVRLYDGKTGRLSDVYRGRWQGDN